MEISIAFAALALSFFVAISFLYFIFWAIVEPVYIFMFNRPVYVHFYLFPKKIEIFEKEILDKTFRFYRDLSPVRKIYFEHRVNKFINNYIFLGRNGLEVTTEMKIKVAAIYIILSFGMRRYLPNVFEAVIIYPDVFESHNSNLHKGEFNPGAKVVVFSWKHFLEGLEFNNDNLNLGLHEFAHVLHFDTRTRRRAGSSAVIYSDTFGRIMEYVNTAANRQKLLEVNYFRAYAYTNQFEFIAVVLEYFFETPQEFKQKLPELYGMVRKMINYKEG